jgi:hypothetical protein
MRLCFILCLFASSVTASSAVATEAVCPLRADPPAATTRHLSKLFDFCPVLADISTDGLGPSTLYNGTWWQIKDPPRPSLYTQHDGALEIAVGGCVASVAPKTMQPGTLPLLSGSAPFYIEFDYALSNADGNDHFPAVYLMPVEHDAKQRDHYPSDPSHFERYQEIDVDEGGFSPGPMGTAIAWAGVWPHYERTRSEPDLHNVPIDRTLPHRFAAAYDPRTLAITYLFDDVAQYVAQAPSVSEVIRKQHFYAIVCAQSHGLNADYRMRILRVRAYARQ